MKKLLLLIAMIYSSSAISAPGGVGGELASVGIRDNGNILVYFKSNTKNPENCDRAGVVMIKNDHIGKKESLSILLLGLSTKKPVEFYIYGCVSYNGKTYPNAITISIKA